MSRQVLVWPAFTPLFFLTLPWRAMAGTKLQFLLPGSTLTYNSSAQVRWQLTRSASRSFLRRHSLRTTASSASAAWLSSLGVFGASFDAVVVLTSLSSALAAVEPTTSSSSAGSLSFSPASIKVSLNPTSTSSKKSS